MTDVAVQDKQTNDTTSTQAVALVQYKHRINLPDKIKRTYWDRKHRTYRILPFELRDAYQDSINSVIGQGLLSKSDILVINYICKLTINKTHDGKTIASEGVTTAYKQLAEGDSRNPHDIGSGLTVRTVRKSVRNLQKLGIILVADSGRFQNIWVNIRHRGFVAKNFEDYTPEMRSVNYFRNIAVWKELHKKYKIKNNIGVATQIEYLKSIVRHDKDTPDPREFELINMVKSDSEQKSATNCKSEGGKSMRERKPQKSTQPVPKPLQSDSEFEEENNYIEPTPTPVAVTDLKAKLQNVGAAAKQRVQDKPTPAPRKTKPFNEPNTGFNDSVDIGDDHQLEELDKKNPVGECIKAFNQGNADRNEKFPTAGYMVIGHKMKNGKGGGEIGKMKLIMSRLSLSNGQLPDFFYFVAREWNSIISEDMAWVGADTFKSEANLGFILAHVHVFIGLYNSNFKNPASKDGSRLRPIHAVKLEAKKAENTMRIEVATRGEPLTDAQQELFVEMSLLNISSFEPYCPIVKKLSYEHQRTLRLAYADYNSERFEQGKKTRPLAVYRNRPKTVADEAKAKKADKPNGSYTRRTNKDMLNHKPKGMSIRDFMDQKFKDAGI